MSDIREAAAIQCVVCDFCSAVHVALIDRDGVAFASASINASDGEAFIAMFRVAMEYVATRCSASTMRH